MKTEDAEARQGPLEGAAEIAYSEMAFAVQYLMSNAGGTSYAANEDRAKRLAEAADRLRRALDKNKKAPDR